MQILVYAIQDLLGSFSYIVTIALNHSSFMAVYAIDVIVFMQIFMLI